MYYLVSPKRPDLVNVCYYLSCVNAVVEQCNKLAKEPDKYPKAEQRAQELYKLSSKVKYKL